jgi:hypothetical protein
MESFEDLCIQNHSEVGVGEREGHFCNRGMRNLLRRFWQRSRPVDSSPVSVNFCKEGMYQKFHDPHAYLGHL